MTDWTHRTIIVPAAFAPMARALAEAAGPAGSGGGMFQAMLSPTAGKPPTHYISAGLIWPEFAYLLPLHDGELWDADQARLPESARAPITERPVDSAGHPEQVVALAAEAQMPVTLAQVQALFSACKVYTCCWEKAMAHLGLKAVVEAMP
jgi:hypothetical protein